MHGVTSISAGKFHAVTIICTGRFVRPGVITVITRMVILATVAPATGRCKEFMRIEKVQVTACGSPRPCRVPLPSPVKLAECGGDHTSAITVGAEGTSSNSLLYMLYRCFTWAAMPCARFLLLRELIILLQGCCLRLRSHASSASVEHVKQFHCLQSKKYSTSTTNARDGGILSQKIPQTLNLNFKLARAESE